MCKAEGEMIGRMIVLIIRKKYRRNKITQCAYEVRNKMSAVGFELTHKAKIFHRNDIMQRQGWYKIQMNGKNSRQIAIANTQNKTDIRHCKYNLSSIVNEQT